MQGNGGKGRVPTEGWQCKGRQPRKERQGKDGKTMEAQSKGCAFRAKCREEEVRQGKGSLFRQGKAGKGRAARQEQDGKARQAREVSRFVFRQFWRVQGKGVKAREGGKGRAARQGMGGKAREGWQGKGLAATWLKM
jgi:hypothetical protein